VNGGVEESEMRRGVRGALEELISQKEKNEQPWTWEAPRGRKDREGKVHSKGVDSVRGRHGETDEGGEKSSVADATS